MTLPLLSFMLSQKMTIIDSKIVFSAPVSKTANRHTLKHLIHFYLADFIVISLFIIACEWFL